MTRDSVTCRLKFLGREVMTMMGVAEMYRDLSINGRLITKLYYIVFVNLRICLCLKAGTWLATRLCLTLSNMLYL